MEMYVINIGEMDYDGSQLHHGFAYRNGSPGGPSISYFTGSADVKHHLVDMEDSLADDFIKSDNMAHFIIELPGADIRETVVWQRFFIRMILRDIEQRCLGEGSNYHCEINGDDIMIDDSKLSVSIATLSMFGGLIHVGINITVGSECPVDAVGLEDLDIFDQYSTTSWDIWAEEVAREFADEFEDIVRATYKVIGVN